MNPLSTDLFDWNPKTKTFTAERTDLLKYGKKQILPYLIPVDPSPPRTLTLVSKRTGQIKAFSYAGRAWCGDELTGWCWSSADGIRVFIANGDLLDSGDNPLDY